MQILFLAGQNTDYLQDLTYAGLASILGKDSVVDFPRRWAYHGRKKHFFSRELLYPGNLGRVESPGVPPPAGLSLSQIRSMLSENRFDLVVLGSCKPDVLRLFRSLEESVRPPWVFVDGGDRREIGGDFEREGGAESMALFRDLARRSPPKLIFKRELAEGAQNGSLFPLQFSLNTDRLSPLSAGVAKKYQVVFWAVESSDVRRAAFKLLEGRYDCRANGTVAGQTFRRYALRGGSYFEEMGRARIALSFRGEGFDTLRYWEVPASGALLLSERPDIRIPENFEDGRQAVFCRNDLSDLTAKIDYYLAHEEESRAIALAGQKHLMRCHTHLRRAEYILNVVESQLGLRAR